ncbi:hypothetical protein AB0H23_31640 [Streptomyces albogriseolus]|uniref:hypothetical protein n=1 Tax=Streptomyces albogriseolus TaxID=1887 RepID=UPI00345FF968
MCTQNTSESSGSDFGLPLSSDEFRSLWDRREKPFERQCPYMPSLPLLLNGKLVEDLERMNAENAGNLYVTPVAYGGDLALAAFTDRKDMLSEAQKVIDSAELHWLMEERAIGCLPEGAPAPQVLDCHDVLDLRGERLRTPPQQELEGPLFGASERVPELGQLHPLCGCLRLPLLGVLREGIPWRGAFYKLPVWIQSDRFRYQYIISRQLGNEPT